MTVVFLTKDVCLSGTISTLRFAAPGRLRALDIIEPENRHSQTPQGTYWLNMTLTSQESSRTGFTHHHIIDIAWSWSQNTPPYTSYCLAGPDRTSIPISLTLEGEGDFLWGVCFGCVPCGNWELSGRGEVGQKRGDHRGSTELKECILEGQVQPPLSDSIQALPFSTHYCMIFLWGAVMRERFKANL